MFFFLYRFGRRKIFLLFTALQVLFTATIGLSTDPIMYLLMMYFNGISTLVNYAAAAVLGRINCKHSDLRCSVRINPHDKLWVLVYQIALIHKSNGTL